MTAWSDVKFILYSLYSQYVSMADKTKGSLVSDVSNCISHDNDMLNNTEHTKLANTSNFDSCNNTCDTVKQAIEEKHVTNESTKHRINRKATNDGLKQSRPSESSSEFQRFIIGSATESSRTTRTESIANFEQITNSWCTLQLHDRDVVGFVEQDITLNLSKYVWAADSLQGLILYFSSILDFPWLKPDTVKAFVLKAIEVLKTHNKTHHFDRRGTITFNTNNERYMYLCKLEHVRQVEGFIFIQEVDKYVFTLFSISRPRSTLPILLKFAPNNPYIEEEIKELLLDTEEVQIKTSFSDLLKSYT